MFEGHLRRHIDLEPARVDGRSLLRRPTSSFDARPRRRARRVDGQRRRDAGRRRDQTSDVASTVFTDESAKRHRSPSTRATGGFQGRGRSGLLA